MARNFIDYRIHLDESLRRSEESISEVLALHAPVPNSLGLPSAE
ncbi:MAG: hypothetical protein ACJ0HG_09390 [Alphaproteobacteria bacterium]